MICQLLVLLPVLQASAAIRPVAPLEQSFDSGRQAVAAAKKDAPAPLPFKAKSEEKINDGQGTVVAVLETGELDGRPAKRLQLKARGETLLIREAGQARSWNDARKACQALAPAGRWDLPTDGDYFALLMFKAVDSKITIKKKANNPFDGENASYYPMWLRSDSEAENAAKFAGTSEVVGMRDGTGFSMFPLGADAATAADLRKANESVKDDLARGRYRSAADERVIAAYIASRNKLAGTETHYNLDIPHRGFPIEVNSLLGKPRKSRLEEQRDMTQALYDAVKNGFTVRCVARQ